MTVTREEAEQIIELHKHLEKPMQDPLLQTELKLAIYQYQMAKGFLEGWEAGIREASKVNDEGLGGWRQRILDLLKESQEK